jgi:chromosome partitioning protein
VIQRNVRLAEAPSFGKPILLYDSVSSGSQNYLGLAREVIMRNKKLYKDSSIFKAELN